MSDLAIVRRLMALGLRGKQLVGVIEILAERDQKNTERKERDRLRKIRGKSVDVPRSAVGKSVDPSAENPETVPSPKETSPTPPKEITPSSQLALLAVDHVRATPKKWDSVRTALRTVLDEVRTQAVIDSRRSQRKPLTERAAVLLANKFAQCDDPNAAADLMVQNGWQGFDPAWVKPDQRGSQARPRSGLDALGSALASVAREIEENEENDNEIKRIGSPH